MPRTRSFQSVMGAIAREEAKRIRQQEQARVRAEREKIRVAKQIVKEHLRQEKEHKQRYIESRIQEVDDLNSDLDRICDELENVLSHTLGINDTIEFDSLRIHESLVLQPIPIELLQSSPVPNKENFLHRVKPQSIFEKIFGMKSRYQRDLEG